MKKSIVLLLILLTSTVSYAGIRSWRSAKSMAYSIISDGGDLYAHASDEKKDLKYNEQLPCHADLQVTPHGVATVVLKDVVCREGDMDIPVSEVVRALHEENDETVSVSCDKQTCKIQYKFIPDYYRKVNANISKDSIRNSSTALLSSTTAAHQYATEKNLFEIRLHVEKSNSAALRLYQRMGYQVTTEEGSRYLMSQPLPQLVRLLKKKTSPIKHFDDLHQKQN